MNYYSTNKKSATVNFREATVQGLAPDKGLYFPEKIPALPKSFLNELKGMSNEEIALTVIKPFVGDTIPNDVLRKIVSETIDFPIPLRQIDENIFSLELFHGPTLAFKDVGARFMSRCLSWFLSGESQKATVLVATSGDTGGAVANGFFNQSNIDVIILYPAGKVSEIQERQLTTNGGNVIALEIDGTFDDCQYMVKNAFHDDDIRSRRLLTSANSINVARWLPQQFYYFFALKQWTRDTNPPVFSVPSGNFGNICAGMLAAYAGLPVSKFIAACNANDVVPRYLLTGEYKPRQSVRTYSNAMDVGEPGNFVRIEEMYRHYLPEIKKNLEATSISDEDTTACIRHIFEKHGYILDPHSAVAFCALKKHLDEHTESGGIFLSTAHPVKFPSIVEDCIGQKIDLPQNVQDILSKEKLSVKMPASYVALKEFLLG